MIVPCNNINDANHALCALHAIDPSMFVQAQALTSRGWVILDVRLADDFDKQHAEGAVNVPLYRRV